MLADTQVTPFELTYNRSTRCWEWTDPESGEILSVPAKQKGDLFRAVVSMLDPDLYDAAARIIESAPQMERSTMKAMELVINNGVEVIPGSTNGVVAMVDSSDGFGRYAISIEEGGRETCQCEHFLSGNAPYNEYGQQWCKHLIAFHLWMRVREDRF